MEHVKMFMTLMAVIMWVACLIGCMAFWRCEWRAPDRDVGIITGMAAFQLLCWLVGAGILAELWGVTFT